ncbi:MAG: Excinuclease ABC subunit B, partial [uncultured Gemmatimonadetes bacterium]
AVRTGVSLRPRGRPATGHRGADRGAEARRQVPDAAGRHRDREDADHGARHRQPGQAGAGDEPQQDARRAALRRAQAVLPAQRRRVLHLVLRLLPARGVRPLHGHVHRERLLHQRGHRAAAPARHVQPDGARRRHHRLLRVVHLRPGRPPGVPQADAHAVHRAGDRAQEDPGGAGRHPVLAQRRRVRARHLPGARRHHRDLPRLRGAGGAGGAVGRRGGAHHPLRSAHGRHHRHHAQGGHLPGQALRDPAPHAGAGGAAHPRGAGRAAQGALPRPEAAGGAEAGEPHQLRHRDDAGDRDLLRHRELLAPHLRPRRGRPPGVPLRLLPGRVPGGGGREPRDGAADRRDVQRRPRAQADAGGPRLPPPLGAGQPAAQVRGVAEPGAARRLRFRHAGGVRDGGVGRRGGGADHPPDGAGGPGGGDPPREGPGGRPARRDPRPRGAQRARAGDHPYQAHVRGPHGVPVAGRGAGALPPLGHRVAGAGGDPARPAPGPLRRADRHQPAARGAGPAGGVAGRHPGRGQGGLPALVVVADPDGGARRPQLAGHRHPVRGPHHRLHAADDRGNGPAARDPGGVQPRERHHPADGDQVDRGDRAHHPRGRLAQRQERGAAAGGQKGGGAPRGLWREVARGAAGRHRGGDARRGGPAGLRARRPPARPVPGAEGGDGRRPPGSAAADGGPAARLWL